MRLISFSAVLLALVSSPVLAQEPSTGDAVGHPLQIQGPPPISEPSATKQATPAASAPEASEPASKGYMGAYGSPRCGNAILLRSNAGWIQDQGEGSLGLTVLRK